jgi:hypothetical protein
MTNPVLPGDGPGGTPVIPDVPPAQAGPVPILRLTHSQYLNTIRDLLGIVPDPSLLASRDAVGTSAFFEAGVLGPEEFRALMGTAEDLAAADHLTALRPCSAAAVGEAACARQFIAQFGKRAFRRPLAEAEQLDLMALFDGARAAPDAAFEDGIRVVLSALLQSPGFLYHGAAQEPSAMGSIRALDSYQRAARLSYFLWDTMPDAGLFAAADAALLDTRAGVEQQARRMLRDPRARDAVRIFHRQWLELGQLAPEQAFDVRKDPSVYDDTQQPALFRSMEQESATFAAAIMLTGEGDGSAGLETLLSAPFSFVDDRLAQLYGAMAVASGGFERRTLPERGGILTHAGFLAEHATASESHPMKRGRVVYERVLCGDVPEPPANVPPPKPPAAGLTTRDRYAEHAKNACAVACHGLIDPIGFAFEGFDAIGRHRSEEGGKTIDTSGMAHFPLSGDRRFANAAEFIRLLATTDEVRACFVRQWFRFAFGRMESDGDAASLASVESAFTRSRFDVRELLIALVTSPSFLYVAQEGGQGP